MGSKKGDKVQSRHAMSRKEMRKQQRQMKKQCKVEHFRQFLSKKKETTRLNESGMTNSPSTTGSSPNKRQKSGIGDVDTARLVKSLGDSMNDEIRAEKHNQILVEKAMKKQRRRQLKDANKEEERTIKQLEKQLKLNKRKNNSLPKSFVDSGLDYILDVCDSSKVQAAVQAEMNLQESGSEFEADLATITGKVKDKKKLSKAARDDIKKKIEDSSEESEFEDDEEDSFSDNHEDVYGSEDEDSALESEKSELSDCPDDDSNYSKLDSDGDGTGHQESTDESKVVVSKRKINQTTKDKSKKIKLKNGFTVENESDNDSGGVQQDDLTKSGSALEEKKDSDEFHEDIYGRLRDKHGNIVQQSTDKYIPPHLRDQPVDDKKRAELEKLNKTLKGLLNRLAENNMHSISNQIDDMYMRYSRHDMNNSLLKQYVDSLISSVHTPERLVMEHAMLIAVLHANIGSEVGAFFLQHLGKRLVEMHSHSTEIENKELDNLILLLCHMYTFKIFDSVLLYDILQLLVDKFTAKDVDLILVILRTVGFGLRKDNPLALKDFILKVQKLANNAGPMKDDARVRFMLEILLSIKNNNVSKIPNYDTSHSEHLKKIIKPMFRKGNYVTELKITLEELLKADERGKWWVVGSAWTGPAPQAGSSDKSIASTHTFTQEILDLAKKHRMNTINRKNIFCILMTAEDYLDAFEKLLKLGLKGQPEQDIVHVLIHCLLSEKVYNPFYSHVADQLCTSDRRHRMSIQYAVWDRFKELKSHLNHQITNLAKFLAHLIIQNSLPLSVLKVLEFTEMDKPCVRLLRQILLSLLLHEDQEAMVAVFSRISKPAKLQMFRESVRLFMRHFLLKNIKDEEADESVKLKEAITLAEQSLMAFSESI